MSFMVNQEPIRRDITLTAAQQRSRRARNIAIGLALGLFALLFYVVTIVKLGPGVLSRPL
jgi:hypothetical protein